MKWLLGFLAFFGLSGAGVYFDNGYAMIASVVAYMAIMLLYPKRKKSGDPVKGPVDTHRSACPRWLLA